MTAATTPSFDLAGKIVFITGASRGIGRASALACAGSGADMIVGVRKPGDGKALVAEIEALGRRALAVQMDLADLASVRAAVAEARPMPRDAPVTKTILPARSKLGVVATVMAVLPRSTCSRTALAR